MFVKLLPLLVCVGCGGDLCCFCCNKRRKRPKCHDCAKAKSEAVMSSHPVLDLQTASNRRYLCVCDACSVKCVLPGYIWTLFGLKQGCLLHTCLVVHLCLSLSFSFLSLVFQWVCWKHPSVPPRTSPTCAPSNTMALNIISTKAAVVQALWAMSDVMSDAVSKASWRLSLHLSIIYISSKRSVRLKHCFLTK